MAEKWILHYAGEKIAFDHNPLEEEPGGSVFLKLHEPGTLYLNRGDGKSVTITTGPNISIMVQCLGERPAKDERRAFVL